MRCNLFLLRICLLRSFPIALYLDLVWENTAIISAMADPPLLEVSESSIGPDKQIIY
jgi:hypothetical protein